MGQRQRPSTKPRLNTARPKFSSVTEARIQPVEVSIDPDPWTLVQVVIGIAGVIGTFVQIAISYPPRQGLVPIEKQLGRDDLLTDAVRDAQKHTEALARFLSRSKIKPENVLERRFRYAETQMLVENDEFGQLRRVAESLAHSLEHVMGASLLFIQHYPDRSRQLGELLHNEINDFARRLNSFFDGEVSNGAVIDECLVMIRTFERILTRLDGN